MAFELVLRGERACDRIELAVVEDVVVSLGFTDGWPNAWGRLAHRLGAETQAAVVARHVEYWSRSKYQKPSGESAPRARAVAAELLASDRPLWILFARGLQDGAARWRILDTDGYCALQTLDGKKQKLSRCDASIDEVIRTELADGAVAIDLKVSTPAELAAIRELKASKRATKSKLRPLAENASFADRIERVFAILTREGLLALRGCSPNQSGGWDDVKDKRSKKHVGAVFYLSHNLADQRQAAKPALFLYWCAFPPASESAVARQIVAAAQGAGLDATEPGSSDSAIVVSAIVGKGTRGS